MRIAIDAMGGDYAPEEIVKGAIEALDHLDKDDELILVGPENILADQLSRLNSKSKQMRIVDAPEVIGMDESPVEALRKKRKSSIFVMARMASHKQFEAAVSAGNTGACVAACQLQMRNLEGVNRPGIAVVLPTFGGPVTLCDVGANIACKPLNLYQYAVMASIYSSEMLGIDRPRVALLNVGEEDAKGNQLIKKARELIKLDDKLNFVGNIEGRDIMDGVCDVAICEGFVGNIILKLTEGIVDGLFRSIKQELMEKNKLLALSFKPIVKQIYKKYDYHEYGGALLLGVNGTAVICHGNSKSRTIKNALLAARRFYINKINMKIVEHLQESASTVRIANSE